MTTRELINKVIWHYGSAHYLFTVLDYNKLTLPLSLVAGQTVVFPSVAPRAKLSEARARRKNMRIEPV
jgi:hypothetical protein